MPTNTSPTLTDLAASATFDESAVNAGPQLIDTDVVFADAEGNFDGGTLSLTGLLAEDRVSVRDEGSGAGQIGLSGSNVSFGGVVIGTLAGGTGNALTITFNAAATSAAIDALIQNLTYANTSDTPTATRDFVLNITDAAGAELPPLPPSFVPLTGASNPFNGIDLSYFSSRPTSTDLDGDGDLDLVVGERYGTLRVFENNGTAGFTELTGAANPLGNIDVGYESKPTFADLDGDGDLDLVVGERDGTLRAYDNNDANTGFTELTGAANPFNGIDAGFVSAPTFADLDGDGDLDMVVGNFDSVLRVFDNNNGNAGFTELTGLANPFSGLGVSSSSNPTFSDLDGDGDLDLVVGDFYGSLRVFDNNDGDAAFTELTGSANPFNGIDVGGYSAPTFADLDGDGDLDLVVGGDDGALRSYSNTTPGGQVITINVAAQSDPPTLTDFASSATFAENTVNAAPQLIDTAVVFADAEGNFDGGTLSLTGLLPEDRVSLNNQGNGPGQIGLFGASVTFGGVVIGTLAGGTGNALTITFNAAATSAAIDALIQNLTYANTSDTPTATRNFVLNISDAAGGDLGTAPVPASFAPLTGASNPFDGIDFGGRSDGTFVDLDGDGDLDLVVSSYGGTLRSFENGGAAGFTELTGAANPFDGIDNGRFAPPAFADLDGDGDHDLVVGNDDGTLQVFDNDANAGFVSVTGPANPFDGIDVGFLSAPAFADLDGDGDLDLLVGSYSGTVRVFANNNANAGFTELTGTDNPLGGIDVGFESNPTMADLDGDGDLDLVVGEFNGPLRVFVNNGLNAGFTELTGAANPFNDIDIDRHSSPAFADLDGDGDLDLVVGGDDGTLRSFENTTPRGRIITINVTAENDAPTATGLPGAVTVVEETSSNFDLSAVTFNDADSDGNITLVLTASAGVMAAVDNTGVTVTNSGTGALTLVGTAAAIDAYLNNPAAIRYTGATNAAGPAAATVAMTADDGTGAVALGTISVNITNVNDAPTLADLTASVTFAENTVNAAPQLIDTAVTFADVEGNFNGGSLSLTGLLAEDRVSVRNEGAGAGQIGLSGPNVTFGGVTIGTLAGGTGNALTITFNGAATSAAIDALIQNLTYANTSNTPTATREFVLNITDAAGGDLGLVVDNSPGSAIGIGNPLQRGHVITINVTAEIETFTGTSDNDNLVGTSASDILRGLAGFDTLNGGAGADTLEGGEGDDRYLVDDALDVIVEVAGGGIADRVLASVSFSLAADDNIEALGTTSAGGTSAINLTGNGISQTITGNAGGNVLSGLGGNDVLDGGRGNNTMLGGAGNDTYIVAQAADQVFETRTTTSTTNAGGIDQVQSSVTFSLDATAGVRFVENLTLTGRAAINGTGNALANTLTGNAAVNTLDGGLGKDVLNGGLGKDVLTGGAGNDTFIFNSALAATNVDRITDYNVVQDTIQLENLLFAGLAPGRLAATAFASNLTGAASDAADRIIYETDTGRVYFDADGNGAGARIHFATVTANLALTNADFFVI